MTPRTGCSVALEMLERHGPLTAMQVAAKGRVSLPKAKSALATLKTKSRVHVPEWVQAVEDSKGWHGVYHLGPGDNVRRPRNKPRHVVKEDSVQEAVPSPWAGTTSVFSMDALPQERRPTTPNSIFHIGARVVNTAD